MKPSKLVLGMAMAFSSLFAAQLSAAEARKDMVCSLVDVVGCKSDGTCLQGSSREFDIPDLLVIDFNKKEVRAHKEANDDTVSLIKNYEETDQQLIFQGIENHQGWTLAVDRENSSLALTSVGEDINLMVFGSCTTI